MAVLALTSNQTTPETRGNVKENHSKVRFAHFNLDAVAVAGDANTTIELCKLPPGPVRVIPELSRVKNSAFGASRVLKIGHRAYQNRDNPSLAQIAEDDDAFGSALDMATATTQKVGSAVKFDVYSKEGITVFATVTGGTIPVGATLDGFIAYTYE